MSHADGAASTTSDPPDAPMTPERWERVKQLFDEAATRPPNRRAAFLQQSCGDDPEVRHEVESLLASDAENATLLERPVAEILGDLMPNDDAAGRHFGAYRTVSEIGRGGMAVVYAAVRDDDQYRKQVAIKLIKRGMDTDAIIARFLKERQILADLEHPNIARMFDGGMSDDGLPYLVMEFVNGVRIDDFCAQQALSLEARLELFRTVCSAVLYAHQNLVIHRDLKPSNILVTPESVPKLLDFGIAKILDHDRPQQLLTIDELRPMTPEYASPEQLRGQPMTTASDIYALGVLLYRLLTGRHPYPFESRSPHEIEEAICERAPDKPSTVVGRTVIHRESPIDKASNREATPTPIAAASRARSTQKLRHQLAGDLDNIVLKALHKVPEKRYSSVEQLAEDIRRHQEGLPVIARPDTLSYRTAKFMRRNRWGVGATILIFLSLVAGIIATTWQANLARSQRATAEEALDFLVDLFENSQPDKTLGEPITARELLDSGADRIKRELGDQPAERARLLDSIGFAYFKLGVYEEAAPRLEEALDIRRRTFGRRHPKVIASLNHLGELRRVQSLYPEAEELLREALTLARQRRLSQAPELEAESLNSLAVTFYDQKRHDEAEPLLRKALELRHALHGEDHQEVAFVKNNLALVLLSRKLYEEAEFLSREVLATNRRLLGERHPDVAINLNNLAEVLRAQGNCTEAVGFYEDVLELRIKVLGDKHPSLAATQNNLAGCLKDIGQYEDAENLYLASLELYRKTLGDEHRDIASNLNNLGGLYFEQRKYRQAETFYRDALALNRKLYRGDHRDIARNLTNLALTLQSLDDLAAAEDFHRQALALNRRLLGDDNIVVANSRYQLAQVLIRLKKLQAAELEFLAALKTRREVLGSGHRDVAGALMSLGYALLLAGEADRATPYLEESLTIWRQWPTQEWGRVTDAQSLLAQSLTTLGRFEEAERLLIESYSALQGHSDQQSRRSHKALSRLIDLYEAWERPDDAARYRSLSEQSTIESR